MGNPSQVSPASHLGVEAMGLLKARLLVQQQQQQQQQQLLQSAHGSAFAAAAARHASFVQHQQQQKQQINQLNNPAAIVAELQRRSHSLPTAATAVLTELQLRKALMEGSNPIFGANPTQENMQESNEVSTMTAATTNTASPTNSKSQKSQDKHSATAFQFPWKLHDMLDRTKAEGNENIVSWVEGGKAFRVHVTEAFVNDILPRFFKQTKYKSFQRQLNLYGFTRLHNGPNKGGYKHTYFQQGQRSLCQLINRNSSSTQNSIGVLSNTISESEAIRDDALSKYRNKKNHSNDINISDSCNQDSNDAATGATSSAQLISPRSQPILSNQVPSFTRIQGHDAAIRIKQFQNQQILAAKQMQRKEEEERLKQRLKGYEAERQLLQLQQSREDEGKTCATGLFDTSTLMGNDPRILSPGVNRESSLPASCTERDVAPTIDIDALGTKATLDTNNNASDRNFRTEEESDDKIKDVADACVSVSSAASIRENTNKLGSEKQKNSLVFHFPYKLYEMLQEAEANNFAHTISWLPGTSCFKVHDTGNFVNRIMPSYFKQTKLKSFQRQLNLYGFIRISSGFCKGGYCHPNFIRGRKDLLNAVLRMKIKGTGKARGKYRSSASANSKRSASSMASLAQNKLLVDTCRGISTTSLMCDVPTSPGGNSATESGIDVILEAIKTRERKDTHNTSNVQPIEDDLPGSSNSSRCTVPSTIDVNINDSADVRNADGLSWRMDPSESYTSFEQEGGGCLSNDTRLYLRRRGV
ncbi:unnamed protein product [Pseudo-nitzschia multistriata]|uniref:HSF-type DNA-binding domain-containing protein n=1 Tax=Pseudo-nitzschia multistriata TaxID=183589 RepID=A0A448ZAD7_9STRA|nr:unnamed protein product [Pseudo-nitzschia multistriata]